MSTSSPQPVTLSDAESKGLQYPGAELPQPTPFDFLVAALQASYSACNAGRSLPVTPHSIEQAIAELEEHYDWIGNDQDEDADVANRVENVAAVVAAAVRLGELFAAQIPGTRFGQIIADNQP